jgi:hypothetical protein
MADKNKDAQELKGILGEINAAMQEMEAHNKRIKDGFAATKGSLSSLVDLASQYNAHQSKAKELSSDQLKTLSEKLKAEKVAKEAIELPDNPDYSGYDKPTFQRKGITPGQPTGTLPGVNPAAQREKQPWAGINTAEPAYKRKAQYDQEREQMKKLAGVK